MIYHENKNLKFKLSRLCFGGAALSGLGGGYGFGEIGEDKACELIKYSLDLGINLFDTAPIYGFNQSEIRLGKYLKGHEREKIHLISKGGISWHSTKRVNLTNDPQVIQSMLEQSLRNLQTDYIDTYMIHWPDPRVDIRYPLDILSKAKDQGKILNAGLCNTNPDDLFKAREVIDIDVLQSECNLFHNAFSELDTNECFTLGWGTLDKGILSGKFKKEKKFTSEDARSWAPWWKKSRWKEKLKRVEIFQKQKHINMLALALKYSLENCESAICGFKSKEQLEGLLKAMDREISQDELENAKEFFSTY